MMADFLIAYWLHSTVLLALAWCLMKIVRPRSPVVRERLWKLAAVLPVLTALCASLWLQAAVTFRDTETTRSPSASDVLVGEATLDQPPGVGEATESSGSLDVAEKPAKTARGLPVEFGDQDALESWQFDDVAPDDDWQSDGLSQAVTKVAVIAPPDEPLESPRSKTFQSDREQFTEGASRGAVMATFDWQPVWAFVSSALMAWVATSVLWLLARSMWFQSRLRKARRIDRGRAVEIVRELQPRTRVRLLIVPGFTEPAAFGLWRPTIVLPPSCEALPREELGAVLAHELGHLVRGDVWWLLIGRVLTTVLGFQPLNRIARREWTAAAECLCDSWAVDRGVERLTLARCLTALAEHRLTGVSLADALAAVGSPSSLRTRIERLVSDPVADPWSQRSRRWLLSGSVIAAAVVSAVMLPLPTVLSNTAPPSIESDVSEPLPDPPNSDGTEMIREIETELTALRTELNHAERLAEQQSDPKWLDAVEQLRDRERQLVERWRVLMNEMGPAQEMGTLIDADLR